MAASNAGSFAASVLLRLSLVASLLMAVAAGLFLLHIGRPGTAENLYTVAGEALAHPVVLGALALAAVLSLRSIMARLEDKS